jgi:two-component system OmpR family sensor kinase
VGAPVVLEILASLIFSAALAAYVTWPMGRIRKGFRSLADGALDTRLGSRMGNRRDEISDLARDFDAMAERLQRLVSSRDRLLHDVSHELRSPLARMRVAMDLARQRPERTQEVLSRIEAEESRLNLLIGDLLNLSRAESAPADEGLYFDVASLLEVVCADAAFEAQPKGVAVDLKIAETLNCPAGAPVMVGDPELIRRAIENVVRNAVRFAPSESSVQVDAHIEGGSIVVEVRDSGPGAGPEVRAIMFEPFAKGASATPGAGLGLAIAKRALIAHGGDIEAFEPADGGMLVRMTLSPARVGERSAAL